MPIKRSIEAAYQRMVVLSEEPGKCPFGALPAKFKLVYKSDVVVHFVNAVLLYMNSFVNKTIQLQQQLQQQREQKEHREQQNLDIADQKRPNPEPTSCSLISPLVMMSDHQTTMGRHVLTHSTKNMHDDSQVSFGAPAQIHVTDRASPSQMTQGIAEMNLIDMKNAEECVETLKKVSEGYSRILLLCSNYESSIADRSFFECFYYFLATCVKFAFPKHEAWEDLDHELGRLFRGEFKEMVNPEMQREPSPGKVGTSKNCPVHWSQIKFHDEDIIPQKVWEAPKKKVKSKKVSPKAARAISLKAERLLQNKKKELKKKQIDSERSVINAFTMSVGSNLLGLGKAKQGQNATKGADVPKKKESDVKKPSITPAHYQGLEKGASVEEHEERFELVAKRIEKNLKASEQLRNYMQSPRRNKALKSPRADIPKSVRAASSKRALNLSPAIATILPHNSKSQRQQNAFKDQKLLTSHGFLTVNLTLPSPKALSPSPVPYSGMFI